MEPIAEIRTIQKELIEHINRTFDDLAILFAGAQANMPAPARTGGAEQYAQTLNIMNTGAMKGRKPICVAMEGETISCPTWKSVFETVIRKCNADPKRHGKLLELRNQYFGKKRLLLASNKNNMRSAVKIDEGLYVETHYDTKSLMDLLLRILRDLDYDYRDIRVMIRP
jgi:hypothetical protein